MSRNILALDIGGTSVKSGVISADGAIHELPQTPVDSSESASVESIIEALTSIIKPHVNDINSIGVCIPGPFDYNHGVSLMTHKFKSLKGVNINDLLKNAIPEIKGIKIRFCHDANAFLAGEMWKGSAVGATRVFGVTLGTGIGVACSVNGEFLTTELGSPAAEVSVWNRPYRDGVVEDYVSTRALVGGYQKHHRDYDPLMGVKGIAEAAKSGSIHARKAFQQFGHDLGSALAEPARAFSPEIIVFGGQISKDLTLFEHPLREALKTAGSNPEIRVCKLGNTAPLYGAASLARLLN